MNTRNLLATAEERGIISAAQREAISALDAELDGSGKPRVEASHGFNTVTVAYAIGALLVVFAFAWFFADRWERLGPWGVLGVALVYAGLLGGCHLWLERRAYHQASGIALALAVALVPVATWSVMVITGMWPAEFRSGMLDDSRQWMAACWVVIDLLTLLAALVAFRWRPSVALTIPLAVMLWMLGLHLSRLVVGEYLVGPLDRWLFLANGLLLCAVAGEVDRWQVRTRQESDYAFTFWLGGLFAFSIAYISIWATAGAWRHLLAVVALVLIALSLLLRRRTHLVFGLIAVFGYLAFLALDVFKEYLSLPAVLATLGILLILTTVWMQRRFPKLVDKVNAERGGAALPPMVTRGPLIVACAMALLSIPDTRAELARRDWSHRVQMLQIRSGSMRARYRTGMRPAPVRVMNRPVTAAPPPK